MKKLSCIFLVVLLVLTSGCGKTVSGKHYAEIDVKDYGTITVELDADNAPITVTNFMELAKSGFYNGLTFQRIVDGFMVQDVDQNASGSPVKPIKGEFPDNGVKNVLSHTKGAISMARSIENDSATYQFFIVQVDGTYLDSRYACFGYVTEGMDIVDKICADTPFQNTTDSDIKANQPIITSIKIID